MLPWQGFKTLSSSKPRVSFAPLKELSTATENQYKSSLECQTDILSQEPSISPPLHWQNSDYD